MRFRALGVLLLAATTAFGADAEFDRIVKAIESHYGTQPMHIPFMGLADVIVKVAHPEGARGFKLAVFEDLKSAPDSRDWVERDSFMNSLSGPSLHPMVRVHSRRNGEATYIFIGPQGKATRLLIATFERNEATVVEVKADVDTLLKSFEEPGSAGHTLGGDRGNRDRDQ
jgi:hypothetical protein